MKPDGCKELCEDACNHGDELLPPPIPPPSQLPSTAATAQRDFGTGYIRLGTTMSQAQRETAVGPHVPRGQGRLEHCPEPIPPQNQGCPQELAASRAVVLEGCWGLTPGGGFLDQTLSLSPQEESSSFALPNATTNNLAGEQLPDLLQAAAPQILYSLTAPCHSGREKMGRDATWQGGGWKTRRGNVTETVGLRYSPWWGYWASAYATASPGMPQQAHSLAEMASAKLVLPSLSLQRRGSPLPHAPSCSCLPRWSRPHRGQLMS